MTRLLHLSALLATTLALASPGAAGATSLPMDFKPWAPDSIWNLPLRDDAPIDPNSAAYVEDFVGTELKSGKPWLNSHSCGMPMYWAEADTPRIKVKLNHPSYMDPALIRAWSAVPMPADAAVANCSDKNFAVFQRQPDGTVDTWEFFGASKDAEGVWTARWGGATHDVERDGGIASPLAWTDPAPGLRAHENKSTTGWNTTATSISHSAGVITTADMMRGRIDHAVTMAIGTPARNKGRWPAQRWDGWSTREWALPEGTQLRLPPDLDLSKRTMTPLVRMIAEAAQDYGIVIRDQTGSDDAFILEQPQRDRPSPQSALLNGRSPDKALAAFPWADLQVIDAPVCTTRNVCRVTPAAQIAVDSRPDGTVRLDTSNSRINQPRKAVAWDLDGDGSYETDGAADVNRIVVPQRSGQHTVGVRITDRAGTVVSGTTTFDVVEPERPAAPTPTDTPIASPAATPTDAAAVAETPTADGTRTPGTADAPVAMAENPAAEMLGGDLDGTEPVPATTPRAPVPVLAKPRVKVARDSRWATVTLRLARGRADGLWMVVAPLAKRRATTAVTARASSTLRVAVPRGRGRVTYRLWLRGIGGRQVGNAVAFSLRRR